MKVEEVIKVNCDNIKNWTYIDITDIPPSSDPHTVTPGPSHICGEDNLVNAQTAVKTILQGVVDIGGVVIASPVEGVVHDERRRW